VLTLVILCGFAVVVGALVIERIHEDFDRETASTATKVAGTIDVQPVPGRLSVRIGAELEKYAAGRAVVRLVDAQGRPVASTRRAPDLGPPRPFPVERRGHRIESRQIYSGVLADSLFVQYARPLSGVQATERKVKLFLGFGVLAGAALALLAGLMIARRAMAPIARLTETAREIERTRDPGRRIAIPDADDEVAELARTLDRMLQALDQSRSEQEALLRRQRQFVADASHELRTPLTSVLANLEFLAETLEGEQGEAARSALRSSHRMRRLVADLLLLARADARRVAPHEPLDVAQVVVEAAAELEPVTDGHDLVVDAEHAVVDGARDELHRLALNLMENAIRHTPPGTHVNARVVRDNGVVRLEVSDDGPGIAPELRDRVFERFVRGAGDRGGSFGLGLSIVRAVAENHGGQVELAEPANGHGTRFVVTLPSA
jgi:signal transduction histidine kinase